MKSIRSQLLMWLVPSFVVIAIIAGASLYLSEERRLEASLDNELIEMARAMKLSLARPMGRFGGPGGMEQNFATDIKSKLDDVDSGYYFQMWRQGGKTLRKSLSLGQQSLEYPALNRVDDGIYNDSFAAGDDVRVHAFMLRAGPRAGESVASLAISRKDINQRLASVAAQLAIGGVFFSCLLSAILVFVIRRALIPVQNLTEQVTQVEAGSLHNRLVETDVPAEIAPLVDRLNQLLARLEQSFARERQFNSDLAHELRTPLATIRTTSEVALKWPEQASMDDYRYITNSAAQLQQTIDSLLALARIEHSGAQSILRVVNVVDIVQECLSLQSAVVHERGIVVTVTIAPQHQLNTDPHLLRIIIANLISNAVEYAPLNSEVLISTDKPTTVLQVENTAPNLRQEDLSTMFDRLWRKDTARTGTKHVGLGLSIAHTAAQALTLELTADLQTNQQLKMSVVQHR